jgi:phosphoribosylformimino-5-aminoimidazole carboxamide ribotide isomerase
MLEGPDLEEVRRVTGSVSASILYSGGIGKLSDLEDLAGLQQPSLSGVIVGKALYEGRFTIAQAHAALAG